MAKLSLVGAGPGDPELITLKAIRVLQKADVILYDALANEELLRYAGSSAILHFAGKRFGCHSLSQQEINQCIVDYGAKHANIVRLKGGDPFVFARAMEELEAARAAGMEVEVVPGISSCIAAPVSAMIPLTCRGVNESFWVTTGTTQSGEISPYVQIAAGSSATVIILMAMNKLEQIADIFAGAGKASTPVAIIHEATTTRQKIVTGTIRDIVFRSQHAGLTNPAVIIIGEVVSKRLALDTVLSCFKSTQVSA
ncbi:uroporphyrinogen-III C-methyltransferase [Terrimonas sp. NA20]|uniref:uroporphyrinogen-III C-methyltransferase n=1 Tax=Terrimonas ginsenosidimutans TaxID=2908004 RepID=A0ABS9KMH5_9BACT|nr:uroporphyrinogen-III C-methyltransferase [Terrimonas ginsenosidimutans]MCG2613509.1 uroporphyrinogen-III C-methyltransferase [Terrimonas ginsenosidimutans]